MSVLVAIDPNEIRDALKRWHCSNALFCEYAGIPERTFYHWLATQTAPLWLVRMIREVSVTQYAQTSRPEQLDWGELKYASDNFIIEKLSHRKTRSMK